MYALVPVLQLLHVWLIHTTHPQKQKSFNLVYTHGYSDKIPYHMTIT